MYNTLSQMGLPKKGKGITKILERIWNAITKFLGGNKDLASATFASFQNFMETQYQKSEVQQELPTIATEEVETYPELRAKMKKLEMEQEDIEDFLKMYEEGDEADKAVLEKGINNQLIKKGINFSTTINNLEDKGFFKKEC